MPVYNGAHTIGSALESLLAQTLADFELIISDNASTDGTSDICRAFAAADKRIRYFRQPQNTGAMHNFRFVLQEAAAPSFMWAAADDLWHPDFLTTNQAVLESDLSVVSSISKVRMPEIASKSERRIGTFPISGRYIARLRQYLSEPGANSRFYGLFRRDQLSAALIRQSFLAADWAIMVNVLQYGGFYEVDEFLMQRSSLGTSNKPFPLLFKDYGIRWPRTMTPLLDFTQWLAANLRHSTFLQCLDLVIRLNVRATLVFLSHLARAKANHDAPRHS